MTYTKLHILVEMQTVLYFDQKEYTCLKTTCFIAQRGEAVLLKWENYKMKRGFVSAVLAEVFKLDKEYEENAKLIKLWLDSKD